MKYMRTFYRPNEGLWSGAMLIATILLLIAAWQYANPNELILSTPYSILGWLGENYARLAAAAEISWWNYLVGIMLGGLPGFWLGMRTTTHARAVGVILSAFILMSFMYPSVMRLLMFGQIFGSQQIATLYGYLIFVAFALSFYMARSRGLEVCDGTAKETGPDLRDMLNHRFRSRERFYRWHVRPLTFTRLWQALSVSSLLVWGSLVLTETWIYNVQGLGNRIYAQGYVTYKPDSMLAYGTTLALSAVFSIILIALVRRIFLRLRK